MYLIRYEKESVKDYILYDVSDNLLEQIISCNNGFQQFFPNENSTPIRIYFKIDFYNKNTNDFLDELLEYINSIFYCSDKDWTILIHEKMLNNIHKTSLLFFSHIYFTTLQTLKNIIDKIYCEDIYFDISAYYTYNSKFKDIIIIKLPNQIDNYSPKSSVYRVFYGNPNNLIVANIDGLIEYIHI